MPGCEVACKPRLLQRLELRLIVCPAINGCITFICEQADGASACADAAFCLAASCWYLWQLSRNAKQMTMLCCSGTPSNCSALPNVPECLFDYMQFTCNILQRKACQLKGKLSLHRVNGEWASSSCLTTLTQAKGKSIPCATTPPPSTPVSLFTNIFACCELTLLVKL